MKMSEKPYLIVGQGLAGTVLACIMEARGIPFHIVNDPSLSSASRIAGGIINPVVLKRLTVSADSDLLLKEATDLYAALGKEAGISFYRFLELVKIFGDARDREFWTERSRKELKDHVSGSICLEPYSKGIRSPEGFSKVLTSGILNTQALLGYFEKKWESKGVLKKERWNYDSPESTSYRSVIFCEGYLGMYNPWFREAGFAPAKGEILTVKIPGLDLKEIINKGVYIIPIGDDVYKVGATFSWHRFDDVPESGARSELEEKLSRILTLPYEVLKQEAGVRSATVGRNPIMGRHPHYPKLAIFNGLGTKAALLAPYYAKMLIDHLEVEQALPKDVDVKRFFPV